MVPGPLTKEKSEIVLDCSLFLRGGPGVSAEIGFVRALSLRLETVHPLFSSAWLDFFLVFD